MALTKREEELLDALERAIETYQYASMTTWERSVCSEDMQKAESVRDKYVSEKS